MRKGQQSWAVLSRLFFIIKTVFFCALLYAAIMGVRQFDWARAFPLSTVKVYGILKMNREEIRSVVLPFLRGGFFALNIEALHDKLLQNPWTSSVIVQRKWPDELSITFVERTPVANWNNQALLSDAGELFIPKVMTGYEALPVFHGPSNQQLLMLSYSRNINRLLQSVHVRIRELELNSYGAWQLTLDNGVRLYVGHKDVLMRVSQFVAVYSKLQDEKRGAIASIDLRYPNGMAVQWADSHS